MNTSFINRRRNLVEPKPMKNKEAFSFGDIFSADLLVGVMMIVLMGAVIATMLFYVIPTFQQRNTITASMRETCGFTPATVSGYRRGMSFQDGAVGFVVPKNGGNDILVKIARTEKQMTFTDLESHESICTFKL